MNQLNTADKIKSKDGNVELTLTELESENQTKSEETKDVHLEADDQTKWKQEDSSNVEDDQSTDSTRTSEDQNDQTSENTRHNLESNDGSKCTEEVVDATDDQLKTEGNEEESEDEEEEEDDDDDEGWITPSNLQQVQKDMGGLDEDVDDIVVGCMTTDFAMQVSG